jgi:hypothetical protein
MQLATALSKIGGADDDDEEDEGKEGMDPAMKSSHDKCTPPPMHCLHAFLTLLHRRLCFVAFACTQLATALSKIGGPDDDEEKEEEEEGMDPAMKAMMAGQLPFLTL